MCIFRPWIISTRRTVTMWWIVLAAPASQRRARWTTTPVQGPARGSWGERAMHIDSLTTTALRVAWWMSTVSPAEWTSKWPCVSRTTTLLFYSDRNHFSELSFHFGDWERSNSHFDSWRWLDALRFWWLRDPALVRASKERSIPRQRALALFDRYIPTPYTKFRALALNMIDTIAVRSALLKRLDTSDAHEVICNDSPSTEMCIAAFDRVSQKTRGSSSSEGGPINSEVDKDRFNRIPVPMYREHAIVGLISCASLQAAEWKETVGTIVRATFTDHETSTTPQHHSHTTHDATTLQPSDTLWHSPHHHPHHKLCYIEYT